MKILNYAFCAGAALLLLSDCACDTKATSEAYAASQCVDSIEVVDEQTVETVDQQTVNEQVIRDLYNAFVFDAMDNADHLKWTEAEKQAFIDEHLLAGVQKRLRDAYDYDGEGMAFWVLRTGAQDGDGPSKITEITPFGQGWYRVNFLDMGIKATIEFYVKDGVIQNFTDVRQ